MQPLDRVCGNGVVRIAGVWVKVMCSRFIAPQIGVFGSGSINVFASAVPTTPGRCGVRMIAGVRVKVMWV